jgi:hAT family C-terminal dimerisation region
MVTSSRSEKVFSTAGEIVSRFMANLEPSTVDMLVFLLENLPAVDQLRVTNTYLKQNGLLRKR